MVLLGALSALLIVAMLGAIVALLIVGTITVARSMRTAGRPRRRARPAVWPGPGAEAALRRHPAGRGRNASGWDDETGPLPPSWFAPIGPDDDPEFIDALERLIRGEDDDGYLA